MSDFTESSDKEEDELAQGNSGAALLDLDFDEKLLDEVM